MITQRINLNLIPGQVLPRFNVSQYDKGSRTLEFILFNGTQSFVLAGNMSVRIQGTKADMHCFDYAATVDTTNQKVVADLTQQMSAAPGDVTCELILNQGTQRLGTCNFVISVEPAALSDDAIISDSDLPDIIAMATEQMENSEAWARGTKYGTPVPSTAEQYHNNAKYYAESVGTYAHDSEAWAVGKRGGTDVGSTDPTYHNNSKYYSQQAGSSATSAGNSATASGNSALVSEGYANGKQNGTPVSSGTYFQNNAKYFSEQAASSATQAASWSAHPPYIGNNGNWWVWNISSGAYVDSGIDASITVDIADITMLDPTATPYVTNTGTDTDPVFHLFIPRGKGISTITKTGTSGLVDTYTITYSDGYTTTFTVTNGKTAYQSAVDGGYTKTEQQFNNELGNFESYATSAAASASSAHSDALDAKAQADRAEMYADFIEPHFIIQNNRLYIKDDAVGEFIVANNRLYMKLVS